MRAVVHPEYVYISNDELRAVRQVSEFQSITPRPKVCCPHCHESVVLALGKINAHHYRHKTDSSCPLKGCRESIMHSNVKFHIRNELVKTRTLKITQFCSSEIECYLEKRICLAISNWDHAEVECRIDKFYADIGLLQGEKVKGVIEVWVKHKTEGEKASFLNQKTSWVEVFVDDESYEEIMAWTYEQPLPHTTSNCDKYVCPNCEKYIAKQLSDKIRQEIQAARISDLETIPSRIECLGIREVDFLFRSRKTYRKYLYLYADWRETTILKTWMQFKNEDEKMYELILPNALNHVKNFYRKMIAGQFRLIEMSLQEYSMRSIDSYIHDARNPNAPEPARYKFNEDDLPGSLS